MRKHRRAPTGRQASGRRLTSPELRVQVLQELEDHGDGCIQDRWSNTGAMRAARVDYIMTLMDLLTLF